MDAVAYQMSFDKEQLALLCANYDRRIDSLGAENKRLKAESDKLRELARLLLYGATHDAEPAEGLAWSQKVDVLVRELGVEYSDNG